MNFSIPSSSRRFFPSYLSWSFFFFFIFLGLGIYLSIGPCLPSQDQIITAGIQNWRNPLATKVFSVFNYFGHWSIVLLFSFFLLIVGEILRQRRKASLFLLAIVLTLGVSEIAKYLFQRSRPNLNLALVSAQGYSFPSNHAVIAVVFYGLFSYFLFQFLKREWLKKILILSLAVLIFLIGGARIYLGVHWFSDIIGGWSLGLSLFILFLGLYQRWKKPVLKF